MPQISRFFGVIIYLYFDDHNPPHFHAVYGEFEAEININNLTIIEGNLPSRVLGLVIEWASQYQEELKKDWNLVKQLKTPFPIKPLE